MTEAAAMADRILEAVTAALTCGEEVFLVRRQPQLPAFPGYTAFPGGKVDKEDRVAAALTHPLLAGEAPQLAHALCRELREELGFDLLQALEAGQVTAIHALGSALTPAFMPVRFDTRLYRIVLREKPAIALDAREHSGGEWLSFKAAYARYEQGRCCAAPPTVIALRALAVNPDIRSLPDLQFQFDAEKYVPCVEMVKGVRQLATRSNTIPPADRTNAFLIGDTPDTRFLVDPASKNDEELERLLNVVEPLGFAGVFLTHHHPDHRQNANTIARRYGVPVHLSRDCFERIQKKTGGVFFKDVETVIRGDGEVLTQWLGEDVNIIAVPGHDEGQLALMPESRAWCIVSDLIQSVGTVVIAKPEGNMTKYFASLEKIIALDPAVIYPSHGPALGSVFRMQETLDHRRMREQQVLELHQAGKGSLQMLAKIYGLIDPRLMPLALCNIESHLDKLRAEGRIRSEA